MTPAFLGVSCSWWLCQPVVIYQNPEFPSVLISHCSYNQPSICPKSGPVELSETLFEWIPLNLWIFHHSSYFLSSWLFNVTTSFVNGFTADLKERVKENFGWFQGVSSAQNLPPTVFAVLLMKQWLSRCKCDLTVCLFSQLIILYLLFIHSPLFSQI